MKIVTLSRISFIIFTVAVFNSCGNNKNGGDTETVGITENVKYILLPDADSILPEWSKENVVVNHWVGDPDNLHPTNGGTASRSWVLQYTSNFILRNDIINLGICPDLAVSMPKISADNLSYSYTLRKDATWDNGEQITAEDAIFMLKANKCPLTNNPSLKSYFENIKNVVADPNDKFSFTIVMKKEYILNVAFLTDFPIIQRSYYDPQNILAQYSFEQFNDSTFNADGEQKLAAWANNFNDPKYGSDVNFLNGSGPYKVVEWTPGQTLTLERKKNHWTQKLTDPTAYETSFPEKIIFKLDKDPNSQKLEIRAQTFDATTWLPTASVLELMQEPDFNKNYNIQFTDNFSFNYIGMNLKPDGTTHKKYFTDAKVRRAMAYLVPVEEIIRVVSYGYAKRQNGTISPLKKEYNNDLPLIPFDVEAAKKLLDEAGWKDTDGNNIRDKEVDGEKIQMEIEFKYQSGQKFVVDMINMVVEAAYKAGVVLIPIGVEANTLKEQLRKHDFDMYASAWASGSFPEDYTQIWHTSSYISGGSNYVGFGNAETDALIDSIKYTLDDSKRIPMEKELQRIIYEEQPYVILYSTSKKNILHKRFGNQYMVFDRPGVILNNMRLLSLYGMKTGVVKNNTDM
ncbi:MAG: hypothetical protein IPI31_05400 [Bacteroidetes bacterium]|nr:hypothetical protein [Bacteroidota bacterium]MBK7567244.1 hypothetical protein [Bacteroidota bacterium]MBP8917031.1 hypothetical protein [Chitinophagales bacterium]MBP9796114.1 hypothetical protein [Chitinophagales bacterium]